MKRRIAIPILLAGALLASMALLLSIPTAAQQPTSAAIYYYRDGQAVPVERRTILAGEPRLDAAALLAILLTGPSPEEQASGLTSPLPAGTELVAVTTNGTDVAVDLRISQGFLQGTLDVYLSDLIVEQIVKTLHPLDLHQVHVHAEDEQGRFVPISDFLPRPPVTPPAIPPNDDPIPDRAGPTLDYVGQPPALGQGQPQGALSGKTIWLSAGHGWYWSTILSRWNTQRPNTFGIVEDFANAEAVNYYLARYLRNAGADVWLVREQSMIEHEVVVDNDDGSPGYVETGAWTTSGSSGYEGGSYRFSTTAESRSATATWTANLPEAGWYAVWAWYLQGANRSTDARYEIHHAGGVTPVRISQEIHGQTWRYLGDYYFSAGTGGHVTLVNESADPGQALIADAIRFGGGLGSIAAPGGTSGQPRWEEDAEYWTRYQGAPAWIYDDDVTARPLYAEWESAKSYPQEVANAVYISWHTNAGGGTGTDSFIHDTQLPTGSVELQDWVHAELVSDLKAAWDPAWKDRGQKTADFGELRELSSIPGILLEVAFHDTEEPGDADDLREPLFRQIAARAVFQGIVKYFAERDGTPSHLLPEPPERLAAANFGPGQVRLTWAPPPCCDGVIGDAATAYKVYQSTNGRAFDNGTQTADTHLTLSGLAPGALTFFRVTALNEGGESFPSPVVAVRTPTGTASPLALIIDGFDRLDQAALIPQWESSALGTAQRMFLERMNRYDYAIEHAQALGDCGLAFDGAVNEAVAYGGSDLNAYALVDWFVGEDSVADASLSKDERAILADYLDGGGRLLISGSDVGYDLVENGRDPDFYQAYLRATYLGDDSASYDFTGAADDPFAALTGSFDDGGGGTYNADKADRLAAAKGSTVVLTYDGGTADGAAVAYAGDFRLVHMGFPLETIHDRVERTALFCAAADFLLPPQPVRLTLSPNHSDLALPGQVVVYTHTLANFDDHLDTFHIDHTSSQGWLVTHPTSLRVGPGMTATLVLSLTIPENAPAGMVETTIITAESPTEPVIFATATDTTTVRLPPIVASHPRLINGGFEVGLNQAAWQVSAPPGEQVFAHQDELPPDIAPRSGDWLAWLSPRGLSRPSTMSIIQVIALPSGEPTVTLTLAWLTLPQVAATSTAESLTVALNDVSGALQTQLLTITQPPTADTMQAGITEAGAWQTATFDLSTFAGETVQLAFSAVASETAFFVDDVSLTSQGFLGSDEFRALWVDAFHDGIKSPQQIEELVETAQAGSLNALVVQVVRRGDTYYPSSLAPWAPDADPKFDALAYLIERAHAAGIEVHAWVPTLAIWSADTPPQALDHPFNLHGPDAVDRAYWLMTSYRGEDRPGGELYYLDPGHPDAVEFIVSIYAELAANYALDGLHLDRVRYPEPQGEYCREQAWYCQDWGYNATSVARFQAQSGQAGVPAPLDEAWLQWRRDQVTALVRRIYLTVTAINPQLRVSAALSSVGYAPTEAYGWETRSPFRQQLQDWQGWLEEGILDLGLPMIYRDDDSGAREFDAWATWTKDHQASRGSVVGTSLYLNDLDDSMAQWVRGRQPSALGNQVRGLCGYSYATSSDEEASKRSLVNAAVTAVFSQPASVPAIPWKDAPSLGHLMGTLSPTLSCLPSIDGYTLSLTGPQTRTLLTDGNGWFGAVDLPPGQYLISAETLTTCIASSQVVTVVAGTVAEPQIISPACPSTAQRIYLPTIFKGSGL